MGIFNRLKRLMAPQEQTQEERKNIYEKLGLVQPFTVLAGGQFNAFIGELSENKNGRLHQTEQEALEELWNAAGIDLGGTGNNLWNLKKGTFELYNKDGILIRYEKKDAEVKDKYSSDNARTNFVYTSKDGNFVINQNDRNQKVFLVYVSEGITERLLMALREAEIEALDLDIERTQEESIERAVRNNNLAIETKKEPSLQEKYKVEGIKSEPRNITNSTFSKDDDGGR
ncbi:MAG: hypothetical protein Q4C64_08445 [Erysipelotrichia bacterium]|nr:hypothetical protein [Erysipelotrichia bacterium]